MTEFRKRGLIGLFRHIGQKVKGLAAAICVIKLIPKPAYAEYLAGNVPERGACEICGRTTDLIAAKIEDSMGVRYRKVCRDCFAANNATEAN